MDLSQFIKLLKERNPNWIILVKKDELIITNIERSEVTELSEIYLNTDFSEVFDLTLSIKDKDIIEN